MERITKVYSSGSIGASATIDEILRRLVDIENVLGEDYNLDRLRELVEADRDGRCVIFRKGYGVVSDMRWTRKDSLPGQQPAL